MDNELEDLGQTIFKFPDFTGEYTPLPSMSCQVHLSPNSPLNVQTAVIDVNAQPN